MATMIPLLVFQSINALKSQTGILALLEGQSLDFSSGIGKLESFNGRKLPEDNELLWDIIRSGELRVLDDLFAYEYGINQYSFFGNMVNGLGACIITPLKKKNKPVGLLILGYANPIVFSVNQMRLITAISDMAGSALHRMSETEKLEKMAAISAPKLEGIYRGTFDASLLSASAQNALTDGDLELGIARLNESNLLTQQALTELRQMISELHSEGIIG